MDELAQKLETQINSCGDQPEVVLEVEYAEQTVEKPLLNGNGHLRNGLVNGNGHLNGHAIQPKMV